MTLFKLIRWRDGEGWFFLRDHQSDGGEDIRARLMSVAYSSGEEIQSGDRILYHGEAGQVEFVARLGDSETGWYVEQFGCGCMILAPSFGRVFISKADEDLEFVSRRNPTSMS